MPDENAAASPPSIPCNTVDWDKVFGEDEDTYFFGREPSNQARTALLYWKTLYKEKTVPLLDLGCGEGRDAVFFAQKGFDVTAVDGSEVALRKTAKLAQEAHVGMTRVRCDIRDYLLPNEFPFLHANNCLQFLGKDCLAYLEYLRRHTPVGGLHSVSVFTKEAVPQQEGLYRFEPNELKLVYRNWKLLHYAESVMWREPLQNYLSFASLVALRVG